MAGGFLTRATCKNVPQNLIPLATAYWADTLFQLHATHVVQFLGWRRHGSHRARHGSHRAVLSIFPKVFETVKFLKYICGILPDPLLVPKWLLYGSNCNTGILLTSTCWFLCSTFAFRTWYCTVDSVRVVIVQHLSLWLGVALLTMLRWWWACKHGINAEPKKSSFWFTVSNPFNLI